MRINPTVISTYNLTYSQFLSRTGAKFLEGEPLVAGSLLGHEEVKAIEAERENEIKRAKTKRAEAGKNAFHDSGRM